MNTDRLKGIILKVAENVDQNTTIDDIYKQLAYLADIEESEIQEEKGDIIKQDEVEKISKQWLM